MSTVPSLEPGAHPGGVWGNISWCPQFCLLKSLGFSSSSANSSLWGAHFPRLNKGYEHCSRWVGSAQPLPSSSCTSCPWPLGVTAEPQQSQWLKKLGEVGLVGRVCIGVFQALPTLHLVPICSQQNYSPSLQSLMQPPTQQAPSQAGSKQGQKCGWGKGRQVDGQGPCYLLGAPLTGDPDFEA